jgi:hypothetical protein
VRYIGGDIVPELVHGLEASHASATRRFVHLDLTEDPLPAAEGLSCCYPCGIDGCDSVCHTREECDMDRMRPSAPPPP